MGLPGLSRTACLRIAGLAIVIAIVGPIGTSAALATSLDVPAAQETPLGTGIHYNANEKLTIKASGEAFYGEIGGNNELYKSEYCFKKESAKELAEGQPEAYWEIFSKPEGKKVAKPKTSGDKKCTEQPYFESETTLSTAPVGALLASIGLPGTAGSSGWFEAGKKFSGTKEFSGELYLLYNDTVGAYENNSGEYSVTATVKR
jgi:hypothetical protein